MKLTLGQFEPIIGDKQANLNRMQRIIEQATEDEADLVLFPELCLTGYFIQDLVEDLSEPMTGPSIVFMQELCKQHEVHVVFSWAERGDDGNIYNSACLIDDAGQMVGNYRKVHLYDREKEIFTPGNTFKVFDTKLGRVGIMICFDLDFPESARSLALQGADIILIPTNNFYPYERYQEVYMKSRAMENEIPVAICNRIGKEAPLEYFGESCAYDAHGHQLIKLSNKPMAKTVEIPLRPEMDENLQYKANRFPQTYTTLTQMEDLK